MTSEIDSPKLEPQGSYNLVTFFGPTASGKTSLAVRVADYLDSEIISADSRQVYIGMDLGTGKDLEAYKVNDKPIPYHLIDIISPTEDFSVFDFQKRFYPIFESFFFKKKIPILVGGTGLYLDSVLRGYRMLEVPIDPDLRSSLEGFSLDDLARVLREYRPDLHNATDLLDRTRVLRAIEISKYQRAHEEELKKPLPPVRSLTFGITCDRETLRERIRKRLSERIDMGMIKEAEFLHASGLSYERFNYFGLEYRYLALYLQRLISLPDMIEELVIRISQFAKRQETWFRKMEREKIPITWISNDDYDLVIRTLRAEGLA